MIRKIKENAFWISRYLLDKAVMKDRHSNPKRVFFCICDHFEPYTGNASNHIAQKRIKKWVDIYPHLVDQVKDSKGKHLKYTFFYPIEQYQRDDMRMLAGFCKSGYGEVEVHLHHHNDSSQNLRRVLMENKKEWHEVHGLLSVDKQNGDISYGFIHGNWALDNSRRDGCWCGVNDEISILQETGCYADFTMPSAPSETQTKKINSIYYAIDEPAAPKSHDTGINVRPGGKSEGLLMIQGPLGLNWTNRIYGIFPRIENGGLYASSPVTKDRVKCWISEGVHVEGIPDSIFIKIYNHGAFDNMIEMFLEKGGLKDLLTVLSDVCAENNLSLHFVTAREMANVALAFEANVTKINDDIFDFRYVSPLNNNGTQKNIIP